jgi:hypothetical protein
MGFLGYPHELRFSTQIDHRLEELVEDAGALFECHGDFRARFQPQTVKRLSRYADILYGILAEGEVKEYDKKASVQSILFVGHIASLLESQYVLPDVSERSVSGESTDESELKNSIEEITQIYLSQNPVIDGMLVASADMYDPTYFERVQSDHYDSVFKRMAALSLAQIERMNYLAHEESTLAQYSKDLK